MAQTDAVSHFIVFQGDVEQREEQQPQVASPTSNSAPISPDVPIGRTHPGRGILLGILLGTALWAGILGIIFLILR
jgi:hypothetical protein